MSFIWGLGEGCVKIWPPTPFLGLDLNSCTTQITYLASLYNTKECLASLATCSGLARLRPQCCVVYVEVGDRYPCREVYHWLGHLPLGPDRGIGDMLELGFDRRTRLPVALEWYVLIRRVHPMNFQL